MSARAHSSATTGLGDQIEALLGGTPTNAGNFVISRLLWSNLNSLAGETYGRLDHSSGFFVKGYLGAGGLFNGVLHDEDFPADLAYSNTRSTVTGSMGYVTADAGYTFLKAPGAKLGAFVGYNFFSQQLISHGCSQVAGDDICAPPNPTTEITVTQDIQFNSLRVGLSAQFMLTDQLKFVADARYRNRLSAPSASTITMQQRAISTESASRGYGTMMEAFFSITTSRPIGMSASGDGVTGPGTRTKPPTSPLPGPWARECRRLSTTRTTQIVTARLCPIRLSLGRHYPAGQRPLRHVCRTEADELVWILCGGHLGGA